MSRGGAPSIARGAVGVGDTLTAAGLRTATRRLARPRISLLNAGWLCVVSALLLSLIGVASIATTAPEVAPRQIAFLCMGIVAAAGVAVVPYRILEYTAPALVVIVALMLVFVLLPFVPESIVRPRNGARRWISLPLMDMQPSELAKIAYIVALGVYLKSRRNYRRFVGVLKPLAVTFIPMALILKEPDLGTSLLFLPTLFAMLLAAGSRIRHLVVIVAIGAATIPVLYPMLEPHQKARVTALVSQWKGETRHLQGVGYQGAKAMTLTGAGGIDGVGLEHGRTLVDHNHLPEEHNDMIFAVISVRWGFVGALATWILFLGLCFGAILVAAQTNDPFGRLVAIGIGAMLFAQMVVNTGMTIGMLPITGMTLPFVSYGGSSLISMWLMIGLLLSIGLRWPQHLSREARDFDHFTAETD
ncbi:MAG: FtsW/RodA/SpoVE family cell cycle protein [Phycisphaerales bacterium]